MSDARMTAGEADKFVLLDQLKERLVAFTCAMNAVQRERDACIKKIVALEPFLEAQYTTYQSQCRNCNEPICSECTSDCQRCGDNDPFDRQDYR